MSQLERIDEELNTAFNSQAEFDKIKGSITAQYSLDALKV